MVKALAALIMFTCGVNTHNVDNPKVKYCYELFVNCAVQAGGVITDTQTEVCKKRVQDATGR